MKKICFHTIVLFSIIASGQHEYDDFIVKQNNDTVYGKIRMYNQPGGLLSYAVRIRPKLIDSEGNKYIITERLVKSLKYNDVVYNLEEVAIKSIFSKSPNLTGKQIDYDSVMDFENDFRVTNELYKTSGKMYVSKVNYKSSDFIVTNSNDTIFGDFKSKSSFDKPRFRVNLEDKFFTVSTDNYKSFRRDGYTYLAKEKSAVVIGDSKKGFLRLLIDGNTKLYDYRLKGYSPNGYADKSTHYFIEKNGILKYINRSRFIRITSILFEDHKDLVKRLRNREFSYQNMYLLVKEYNDFLKN